MLFHMAKRIVLQIVKDRRSLALLFAAPLFVLFLLYTVLNSTSEKPGMEMIGLPSAMEEALRKEAAVTAVSNLSNAMDDLKYRRTDAVVTCSGREFTVHVEGSDTSVTAAVKKAVASAMASYEKDDIKAAAQQKIDEQKQKIQSSIDAQISAMQASIKSQMRKQQTAAEAKMKKQTVALKSAIQKDIRTQLEASLTKQVKAALESAAQKQRQSLTAQISAYEQSVRGSVARQLQSYGQSVAQAVQSYLEENGASGGKAFTMPAFTMPEIKAPEIAVPEPDLSSLSLPEIDLSGIQVPSLSLPSVSVPEIKASDIQIPDFSFSIETAESKFEYINGSDSMSLFDSIAPYMMGFFVFFFVFILAGVSFLRERVSGTLDRLLATPLRRRQIVLGYFLGFGIFVFLQTLLIQAFMVYVLHVTLKGSFMLVLLTNLLLASGSLALGTFLSAFARNEMQMFEFIPVVIVPQILFCGIFSLKSAPPWVKALSAVFPLTYGSGALTDIAVRGLSFSDVAPSLAVLFLYTALFLTLNTLVLKRYRAL